jgi:hypothetical protein
MNNNCNDSDNEIINYTNFSLAICTGILNACALWISISKMGYINLLREENRRLVILHERLNRKYKKLINTCTCKTKHDNTDMDPDISSTQLNINSFEFDKDTMSSIAKSLVSSFAEEHDDDDVLLNKNIQDIRMNHPEIDLGLDKNIIIIDDDDSPNNVYYNDIYTELDNSTVDVINVHCTDKNTELNTSIDLFTEEDILHAKHDQPNSPPPQKSVTWGGYFTSG